ncbi:hypothetical protein Bhyg_12345, partial [Pseudolycoriella hygida]
MIPVSSFGKIFRKRQGHTFHHMYIRNVLCFHGFNSAMSIKLLEDDDLNDIEKSVQSRVMANYASSNEAAQSDPKELYGPFASNASFCFLRGQYIFNEIKNLSFKIY